MRELVNFLKKAVDRQRGGALACYTFRGGLCWAQNGAFQAGGPLPLGADAMLLAEEVEKFLDRTQGEPRVQVRDGTVTVTQGRLRATMRSSEDEPVAPADLEGDEWREVPAAFCAALGRAAPFAGENLWTKGIRLSGSSVTAINNRCGIEVRVGGLAIEGEVVLHRDAAAYVGEFAPEAVQQRDGLLLFKWADGRWLRVNLLADKFPPAVDAIFAKLGEDAPCQIDQAWREAWADASALADKHATMLHDRFIVERASTMVEVACRTGVPEGHSSRWAKDVLDVVVPVADAWCPTRWPDPCLFAAPSCRGVVMGVK